MRPRIGSCITKISASGRLAVAGPGSRVAPRPATQIMVSQDPDHGTRCQPVQLGMVDPAGQSPRPRPMISFMISVVPP
jgi:hypothetical protein